MIPFLPEEEKAKRAKGRKNECGAYDRPWMQTNKPAPPTGNRNSIL